MKLLILTQKVDINDDLLGVYHSWIANLAQKIEKINVICLSRGEFNLPQNVSVYSLGKETGRSRLKYATNFFRYIWRLRQDYDYVFVHMNKEYVLAGGIFWRLLGKKIMLWYNHGQGNLSSRLAGWLADMIFFTSPFSFFSSWAKAIKMPAGIDTEKFLPTEASLKIKNSILFLGRISPVKNAEVLLAAADILDKKGIDFLLDFVGEAPVRDRAYFEEIKKLAADLEAKRKVKFLGKVPNRQAPDIYNAHQVSVNLTGSGSFDKTILEAMACQLPMLVCNRSFCDILPPDLAEKLIFEEKNSADLSEKLLWILGLGVDERQKIGVRLREIVVKEHSLEGLVTKLLDVFAAL